MRCSCPGSEDADGHGATDGTADRVQDALVDLPQQLALLPGFDKVRVLGLGREADDEGRAQERARRSSKILGNLPQTIRSVIRQGLLTIESTWDSPAVRALNDGATVNNNATLPPRPFFEWEEEDVEYLVELFRRRSMLASSLRRVSNTKEVSVEVDMAYLQGVLPYGLILWPIGLRRPRPPS
jgi:hypothetical protein